MSMQGIQKQKKVYYANLISTASTFRQRTTEWTPVVHQGSAILTQTARKNPSRALKELSPVMEQLQELVIAMTKLLIEYQEIVSTFSIPEYESRSTEQEASLEEQYIIGDVASLVQYSVTAATSTTAAVTTTTAATTAAVTAAAAEAAAAEATRSTSESISSTIPTSTTRIIKTDGSVKISTDQIPTTQTTPLELWDYLESVLGEYRDELALKLGIHESLAGIAKLSDSGQDTLPTLLDQQLTTMIVAWDLEPYLMEKAQVAVVEEALGILGWQMGADNYKR